VTKNLPYLLLGLSLFLFGGCSIKEDRIDCPCYLKIFFQKDIKSAVTLTVIGKDKTYFERTSIIPSNYPKGYTLVVPKDRYDISCIGGQSYCQLDSNKVVVSSGKQYDKLFLWSDFNLPCTDENSSDTVNLHKQFCKLTINLVHADTMKTYPYLLRAESSFIGVGIYSLEPVSGFFRCIPTEPSTFVRTIILPRQGNGEMTLVFTDIASGKSYPLDLASIFSKNEYDWKATDLKDVDITIDFATPTIGIVINDWTEILMNYEI